MKKSTIVIVVAVTVGMLIAGVVINHEIRKVLRPIEQGTAAVMTQIESSLLQFTPPIKETLTDNC